MAALRAVAVAGVNMTDTAQLVPAASWLPQVVPCAKAVGLAPERVMEEMMRMALPVLLIRPIIYETILG